MRTGGLGPRGFLGALALGLLPLPPILPPLIGGDPDASRTVRLVSTGKQSELVRSVAVTRKRGQRGRVVMSIGPRRLPQLRAGDRLRVAAEVQASTTCAERGRRCIGRRYRFDPKLSARLMLADRRKRGTRGRRLSGRKSVVCKQRRPHRNHHCTLTFANGGMKIRDPERLRCAPDRCHVNLVLDAHHPRARRGNRVVVGADRPSGEVKQGKGRLHAIRVPAEHSGRTTARSAKPMTDSLPLRPKQGIRRRVVHSVAVPALRSGEVLQADGRFTTRISHLPYNAFVSARLILAQRPLATTVTGTARQVASRRGRLAVHNGFNCTRGPSGYRTPCVTRKAGAVRIRRDALDAEGSPKTLYVNLVAAVRPRLRPARDFHRARVSRPGALEVIRYPPR